MIGALNTGGDSTSGQVDGSDLIVKRERRPDDKTLSTTRGAATSEQTA